tara:strand:- start:160 stop:723 length:564 start_codon:yes stop_codon:yes gene_type:complete
MGFLPKDYQEPESTGGRFFSVKDGENFKIRILGSFQDGSGIMGYQGWKTDKDPQTGKEVRRPMSSTEEEKGDLQGKCDAGEKVKFFWALPIYVYGINGGLKVWRITQKSIRDRITALAKDEDFGDPHTYDLKVSRTGTGMSDTEYHINPLPPADHPKEVQDVIDTELIYIKMKALFTGDDPFESVPV